MQTIRLSMTALLVLSAAVAAGSFAGGCSSGGGNTTDGGGEGGGGNTVTQTGQIVDYSSKAGLGGMIVSSGTTQVATDNKGKYSLSVVKGQAYTMTTSSDPDGGGAGYLTLDEQEWMLIGDADRGQTSAVSNGTESLLKNILQPPPDPSLAVLSIQVKASNPDGGPCTSATGATISVPGLAADGGTGAHLVYFAGTPTALPDPSATSVTDGLVPSAIIYDMPVGMFSAVTVTPPAGCTVEAFPVAEPTAPNIMYTGNVKLEASQTAAGANVASFMRVFLK